MGDPVFVDTNVWSSPRGLGAKSGESRSGTLSILRAAEVAGCRRVLREDLADGEASDSIVVENP
jgi:predicted nucleic acid-binding protein